MRERNLIAAALITGTWAVACSKPTAEQSKQADQQATAAAQANLVSTPSSGAVVVSGLEAGQDPRLTLPRPPAQKPAMASVRGKGPAAVASSNGETHGHAQEAAVGLVPTLRMTSAALPTIEPAAAPAAMPLAANTGAGPEPSVGSSDAGPLPVVSRGPAVIIRGGMGGVHDDCDLHRRGTRGGIAVNRLVPALGAGSQGGLSGNYWRGNAGSVRIR